MRKAQVFSYDLMFAIIVFLAVVFTFFHVWDQSFIVIDNWEKQSEMKKTAFDLSQVLTSSPGVPFSWNENNVDVIGLTSGRPNLIDPNKFSTFESMNFTAAKEKMNLRGYNVTFQLYSSTGGLISTVGETIPTNIKTKVAIDNFISKDNILYNLKVIVWE